MSATGQLAKSRTYFCVMYTFELLDTNFGSCRIKAPTIAEVFVSDSAKKDGVSTFYVELYLKWFSLVTGLNPRSLG